MAVARTTASGQSTTWLGGIRISLIARYLALIALGIFYAMPFVWMVSLSLKPFTDLNQIPPLLIPSRLAFENYTEALFQPMLYFPQFFLNTFYYVGLSVLGEVLSSAIVAYGFARLTFRGQNTLFALVLSTMMLPDQITLIPLYVLFKQLNWIDTYLPLIIPAWFGYAFSIFLFRQFFMTIPREIDDAAMIDGANHLVILYRLMVPLSIPAVITCVAIALIRRWNDFFGPLVYINTNSKQVLAVALTYFHVPQQTSYENLLMAAAVATVIPAIIMFLILQDYFVQGITLTGLKEG